MAATTLTPAALAEKFNTDPKTVRSFLRSITPRDEQPGKGSRWAIEATKVRTLRAQFTKWEAAQEVARAERAAKRAEAAREAAEAVDADDDGVELDDTADELEEPTMADLAPIETDEG